jgi:Fe-S-cluster containining protein
MECNRCTICCKQLQIIDTDSKEGDLCRYCEEGVGCKIYSERPEACKIFECCWKQMKITTEELRPDNCGVLFEKWSDRVIVGSTETNLSKLIFNQIGYFQREGISILIVNQNEKTRTFYLADGHTTQSVEEDIKWRRQAIQKTSQT